MFDLRRSLSTLALLVVCLHVATLSAPLALACGAADEAEAPAPCPHHQAHEGAACPMHAANDDSMPTVACATDVMLGQVHAIEGVIMPAYTITVPRRIASHVSAEPLAPLHFAPAPQNPPPERVPADAL